MKLSYFLNEYLKERPLFLSLIRAKEAWLFQKYLPINHPSVDVGCGDGFFANLAFGRIDTGIDLPSSRINEAGSKKVYRELLVFDGRRIPIKSNSTATCISNCVMEHVEDPGELIKEIFRITKPGGRFFVTVMAKPWEDNLIGGKILGKTYRNWLRKIQVHLNLLTEAEWSRRFKRQGWIISGKTGYLSPRAANLIEIAHYLSLPSLISYKLTKKWALVPGINLLPVKHLAGIMGKNVKPETSGAILYVLQKP